MATEKETAMRMVMLLVAAMVVLSGATAQATVVWGYDNGSEFLINPSSTNPGGYTSYANIDAAVAAGVDATRTVMEFEGDWSSVAINETIDLRNDNLTFQGASGGVTMTWSSSYTGAAFGDQDNASMTATIKDLGIVTQGTGAGGVSWADNGGGVRSATLTVSNVTIDAVGTAVHVWSDGSGGNPREGNVDVTVTNSLLKSSAGSGITCQTFEGYSSSTIGSVLVQGSRIEAYTHGVYLSADGSVGGTEVNSMQIESTEIVCTNPTPTATQRGVYIINGTADMLTVSDTLVAGFGRGIDALCLKNTGQSSSGQCVTVLNSTLADNTVGIRFWMSDGTAQNYTYPDIMLVNTIIAGSDRGMELSDNSNDGFSRLDVLGDNNAFFANTTDVYTETGANRSYSIADNGRLTPAYTLGAAFDLPDYRLLSTAVALLDVGEQFTTAALGGATTFVDYNNDGTYQDGTDYVIDLGGGTPTGSTRLIVFDVEYLAAVGRLLDGTVDVGAYEGAVAQPVAEPAGLGLLGIGLLGLRKRRS